MKILLISPLKNPQFKRPKGIRIPQLALHILAALTPENYEVKIIEEEIDDIDLDEECDLVGISCMTSNAPRAYIIAREFKNRGKKVVMGGVHPTLLPDEASQHCDSVVIGEAEGVWKDLLEDFSRGKLKKKYYKPYPSLENYIPIRHRKEVKKRLFNVIPVMTTRGCPFRCDFCCVHDIFGRKIRHIPIPNVIRDIEESEGKVFLFLDDNIMGDPEYAKKLFRVLKPLKILWGGQASISFVKNQELIKLAADSGCGGLFFGLESVSMVQLEKMRKSIKEIYKIEEAIKRVRGEGIHFHASLIFGFDDDTVDIFPRTLDFLEKNNIGTADFNILTPYPGTRTYAQLKKENRLLTEDWRYYDHSTVVFRPKNLSPLELQAGRLWIIREFTRVPAILKRLPFNLSQPLFHIAVNFASRKSIINEIKDYSEIEIKLKEWAGISETSEQKLTFFPHTFAFPRLFFKRT